MGFEFVGVLYCELCGCLVDFRNITFSAKKLVIGLDKINNLCYNDIMKNNNNNTNTTLTKKGKFDMTYTVKRNTEVLYNGTDLVHAKWRFQLSSQMNKTATLTLRSFTPTPQKSGFVGSMTELLMMHSRNGLVLNKLS